MKTHQQYVQLGVKNRQLESQSFQVESSRVSTSLSPKKKGLWNMEYSEENYKLVKEQIDDLKREKQKVLGGIRQENIILSKRLEELKR